MTSGTVLEYTSGQVLPWNLLPCLIAQTARTRLRCRPTSLQGSGAPGRLTGSAGSARG